MDRLSNDIDQELQSVYGVGIELLIMRFTFITSYAAKIPKIVLSFCTLTKFLGIYALNFS